jgi:hypothetical protein
MLGITLAGGFIYDINITEKTNVTKIILPNQLARETGN